MALDFSLINQQDVGWDLVEIEVPFKGVYAVKVPFEKFIPHYIKNSENYKQVYNKLRKNLRKNLEKQNSTSKKNVSEILQERGMLMNSMSIIRSNYF